MFVEFQDLSAQSRIWIYQSNRIFTNQELEVLCEKTTQFVEQWTSHGSNLKGSFAVKYQQFLVLGVGEESDKVSGCSIDSSVRFVQGLEKLFNIELMDKMNISFKDKNHIHILKMNVFKQHVYDHKITSETIVFNNLVSTKQGFETEWEIPLKKSWH